MNPLVLSEIKRTLRRMRPSLSRRLLVQVVVLWLACGVLATGVAYLFSGRSMSLTYDRLLADDAHALAAQLRWNDGKASFNATKEMADYLVFDSLSHSRYVVRTQDGRKLVGDLTLDVPAGSQVERNSTKFFDSQSQSGLPLRLVALYLQPTPGDEAVWVLVAESKAKRQHTKDQIAVAIFLPAALACFLIFPLIYLGIRRGLEPTRRLSAEVARHLGEDLSLLPVDDVPEELRDMVAHTNILLQRLQVSIDEQRRFIADAAHQLQTPIAGIRLLVGDMLRVQRADPRQPVDAQVLNQLDEVATRGARMVKQLLAYTRAGEAQLHEHMVFDAAPLVGEAVDRWQRAAQAASKRLVLQGPLPAAPVAGSPTLLGEVVSNLVDNAIRYGGQHILVELRRSEAEVYIEVLDDGVPLPNATREQMFLPFWRGNHGYAEGSGLGLSIAQRIMRRMGGELELRDTAESGGTCLRITLPLHAA